MLLVYYNSLEINKLENELKNISKVSLIELVLSVVFFMWFLFTGSEVMGILSLFLVTWAQIDQLQFKMKNKGGKNGD